MWHNVCLKFCKNEENTLIYYGIQIAPCSSLSYYRVWGDGAMVRWRWCDDDGAMIRWRDGAITMTPWYNSSMAMMLWQWYDDDEAMLYRAIVIASSHHRAIDFFHMRFVRKCRQVWIFIRHTNVNNGILDLFFFIPETLNFLAYCCKIIKKVSNAFFFSDSMWTFKKKQPECGKSYQGEGGKGGRAGYSMHYRVIIFPWFFSS